MEAEAEAEFTGYMHQSWARLVRLGYALTGDLGLAEDVVQTALSRAYSSWPRVIRAGNPDAYVRAIVINVSRDRARRRGVPEVLTEEIPDSPWRPDGTGIGTDERPELLAALMRLPERQRAVLVCRYWLDMSDYEIAARLACGASTVRSLACRALAALRLNADLTEGAGNER